MVDLLDIAPPESLVAVVELRDGKGIVHGISAEMLATLSSRFPEIAQVGLNLADNIQALAAVVAAGLGKIGDEAAEAKARKNLSMPELAYVVSIINGLTMPPERPQVPGALRNGAAGAVGSKTSPTQLTT